MSGKTHEEEKEAIYEMGRSAFPPPMIYMYVSICLSACLSVCLAGVSPGSVDLPRKGAADNDLQSGHDKASHNNTYDAGGSI